MGNEPRNFNPYSTGGPADAPKPTTAPTPTVRDGFFNAMPANPAPFYGGGKPATTVMGAPIPTPSAQPQQNAMTQALQGRQMAATPGGPTTAPVAAAPAAAPKAATPAPAVAPAAPKAATPAPVAAPAAAAAKTPTAPKARAALPENPVVAAPPKTTAATPAQTTLAAAQQGAAGDTWTPEQIKAGGRYELPPNAPAGAIGRNWVPYVKPTVAATPTAAATPATTLQIPQAVANALANIPLGGGQVSGASALLGTSAYPETIGKAQKLNRSGRQGSSQGSGYTTSGR